MRTKPQKKYIRELIVLFAICFLTYFLTSTFDTFEVVSAFFEDLEHLELDELLITLFVLAIGLALFSFRRLKENQQAYENLEYQANHDSLTNLPNRYLLHDRLEHAFQRSRRSKKKIAVISLDLTRFKIINDSLGYSVGDKLLREVGARLCFKIRKGDTVGRLVGDEFLICVEDLNTAADAGVIAQHIADIFVDPFVIEGHELFVSANIGISIFPDDGENQDALIANADTAMYQSKNDGKNSCRFYSQDLTTAAVERAMLESNLRSALKRNELIIHYQPQVSLETGEIFGAEALVRWQHPERGLVSPDQFIPLAEECGLIIPIGEWVLRIACEQMQDWIKKGYALNSMAVNVAGGQITRIDLVALIKDMLTETGLEAHHLELEITEGFVMDNPRQNIRLLHELKSLGVILAIDDFGTGYSSLTYLKQFPIDKLKIDKAFVNNLTLDTQDDAIARTIISLGHALNMSVIAEGVETEAQRDFLRSQGCDEVQGYYYSRPVPPQEFELLLNKQNFS